MSKLPSKLIFFLMVICHQQYSEIMNIPIEDAKEYMDIFKEVMEKLFGGTKGKANVRKIASGINIKEFEEMWKE